MCALCVRCVCVLDYAAHLLGWFIIPFFLSFFLPSVHVGAVCSPLPSSLLRLSVLRCDDTKPKGKGDRCQLHCCWGAVNKSVRSTMQSILLFPCTENAKTVARNSIGDWGCVCWQIEENKDNDRLATMANHHLESTSRRNLKRQKKCAEQTSKGVISHEGEKCPALFFLLQK